MSKLMLLGRAAVLHDEGDVAPISSRRHPVALLALLAMAPSYVRTRTKLLGMLWPDAPEKVGRNRLTTCVHQIRGALGDNVLWTAGNDLQLNVEALPTDAVEFENLLTSGEAASAVARYRGPFLDGFWLSGASEFEEWAELARARLERKYWDVLETLAREADADGNAHASVRWWRERSACSPLNMDVTLALMDALVRKGSRGEAKGVADAFRTTFREQLSEDPGQDFETEVGLLLRKAPKRTRPGAADARGWVLERRSLAVLPFEVSPGGQDSEILAQGIHEDLLTELSRYPDFTVISRASVLPYRDAAHSGSAIAETLGVAHLVRGSLHVADDRLRLRVRLVDPSRDSYVWAERYDRELTPGGVFDIQIDLARKIARTLDLATAGETGARRVPSTNDLEAYRLYARGRALMASRSRAPLWQAVECFERATAVDAGYALAWAGLADALTLLGDYEHEDETVVKDRAEGAARRALELDPDLSEGHSALGNLLSWQRRIAEAIQAHTQAIRLGPGYAHAHQWLCWVNLLGGNPEAGLGPAARAVRLDPFEGEARANYSIALTGSGDPEQGLAEARGTLEVHPYFEYGIFAEGLALWSLGEWQAGADAFGPLVDDWARPLAITAGVVASAMTGRETEARESFDGVSEGLPPFYRAIALTALGDADEALQTLVGCERLGWPETLLLRYHPEPLTAHLRSHRGFDDVLEGLDRSWGV